MWQCIGQSHTYFKDLHWLHPSHLPLSSAHAHTFTQGETNQEFAARFNLCECMHLLNTHGDTTLRELHTQGLTVTSSNHPYIKILSVCVCLCATEVG